MKRETNIGIKSYRNAEVNGMEHTLWKLWKSLGTKAHQGSYMKKCEMCIWWELKKKSYHLCVSKERLIAYEEQRPSHSLIAFPLLSYFFSYLFLVFHSSLLYQPHGSLGWWLCSKVSAGLGSEHPDAGRVAGLAEDVSVQWVAALVVSLRQEAAAILERWRQVERISVKMWATDTKINLLSVPLKASVMWLFTTFACHTPPALSNPSPGYEWVCHQWNWITDWRQEYQRV